MNEIIHKIKGYLGYEVPIQIEGQGLYYNYKTLDEFVNEFYLDCINKISQNVVKLKLRPLESLTDEELTQMINDGFRQITINSSQETDIKQWLGIINELKEKGLLTTFMLDYFHKNHIDYQDLIGQGLAVSNVQNMHKGK